MQTPLVTTTDIFVNPHSMRLRRPEGNKQCYLARFIGVNIYAPDVNVYINPQNDAMRNKLEKLCDAMEMENELA